MSRPYSFSPTWRPSSFQNHPTNDSLNNRYPPKDWTAINNKADDQIAPKHASRSTDSLQRWALATADIKQQGYGKNERQIAERIESRYADGSVDWRDPWPRYGNAGQEEKRQRPESLAEITEDGREAKRMRIVESDGNMRGEREGSLDYAESSEWSFPESEGEDVTRGGQSGST